MTTANNNATSVANNNNAKPNVTVTGSQEEVKE